MKVKKLLFLTVVLSLLTISHKTSKAQNSSFSLQCPEVVPTVFQKIYQEEWGLLAQFEIDGNIYEEDTPTLSNMACGQFEKLAIVIKKIHQKFGNYLKYPQYLTVNMVTRDSNAYNFSGHLNLPKEFFLYNRNFKLLFKHPKFNIPIWAHEYGHSIFNQMMAAVSPRWKKMSSLIFHYKNNILSFVEKHNPLLRSCKLKFFQLKKQGFTKKQAERKLYRECTAPILKLRKEVERQNVSLDQKMASFEPLMGASGSYNEFFADVIAVSLLNDGHAVHDSLHRSGLNYHRSPQQSLGRDFDTHKNDLDVLERMPAHYVDSGIHNLLSAVRAHVWKYYLSNPIYKKNIGLTVQKIFQATAIETFNFEKIIRQNPMIYTLLQYPMEDLQKPQQEKVKEIVYKMNKSLINTIDRQFEK